MGNAFRPGGAYLRYDATVSGFGEELAEGAAFFRWNGCLN